MQVTIVNMVSHQVNTGNENESLIGLVFILGRNRP